MCVYSAIFDRYIPQIPVPTPTPYSPDQPWLPVVPATKPMTPDELVKLIEAFRKAAEEAKKRVAKKLKKKAPVENKL